MPLPSTPRLPVLPLLAALALLMAACGASPDSGAAPSATSAPASTGAPSMAASAPTARPAAPPAAASPSARAAAPTAAGAAPAASASPGVPTPDPAAAASGTSQPAASAVAAQPGGAMQVSLAEQGNEIRFRVQEQLAGHDLPSEAVGKTNRVTGSVVLGPDGTIVAERSKFTADLASLTSDQSRRDNYIKRNTLETDQFPAAEFVPQRARGLPWPLPASGEAGFTLLGDLTVHGVTRPVTWDVKATFGPQITGTATTQVKITDFGMTPPKVGPVLSVNDQLTLELDFAAQRP